MKKEKETIKSFVDFIIDNKIPIERVNFKQSEFSEEEKETIIKAIAAGGLDNIVIEEKTKEKRKSKKKKKKEIEKETYLFFPKNIEKGVYCSIQITPDDCWQFNKE